MRFLVTIDRSHAGLEAEAKAACKDITNHEIVWCDFESADMSSEWDATLLTPGPGGVPASFLKADFTVEVQPHNIHNTSPDHTPTGTDALFLGAGADSYRHVIEALIAKEAAS